MSTSPETWLISNSSVTSVSDRDFQNPFRDQKLRRYGHYIQNFCLVSPLYERTTVSGSYFCLVFSGFLDLCGFSYGCASASGWGVRLRVPCPARRYSLLDFKYVRSYSREACSSKRHWFLLELWDSSWRVHRDSTLFKECEIYYSGERHYLEDCKGIRSVLGEHRAVKQHCLSIFDLERRDTHHHSF